jgi:hypothetical protein
MGHLRRLCRLAIPVAAVSLAVLGAVAVPARSALRPASAAVTSFTIPGELSGVAATSAGNAWAVGDNGNSTAPKTLILHWNGIRWSQVTNPKPVQGTLNAVDAVSADDVWAVGCACNAAGVGKALVLHWNGKRWSVPAGVPAIAGGLTAVTVRGNSLWAVGESGGDTPLFLHWAGNRWYVIPSSLAGDSFVEGIVVTGGSRAWAVGDISLPDTVGVVLRWNGTLWQQVSSPLRANYELNGLAAGPAGAIWVVGDDWNSTSGATAAASMLWNGKTWRKVPVGPFPPNSLLNAVKFFPGGTAWAVGYDGKGALILRWTGHAWTQVANPDDSSHSSLVYVAATSASNAWAVGSVDYGSETLILHWNGKAWS